MRRSHKMRAYFDDTDVAQLVALHTSREQTKDTIEYNVRAFVLKRAIVLYCALLRRWRACPDTALHACSDEHQRRVIRSVFKSRLSDYAVLWGPLFTRMGPRVRGFYSHISDDDAVWDTIYPPASSQVAEIEQMLPHGLPEGESYPVLPEQFFRDT